MKAIHCNEAMRTKATIKVALCLLVAFTMGACGNNDEKDVYISWFPRAYAYHVRSDCRSLQRTMYTIEKIPKAKAEQMGRRPCGICRKRE